VKAGEPGRTSSETAPSSQREKSSELREEVAAGGSFAKCR